MVTKPVKLPAGCKPKDLRNGTGCPFTKTGETCKVSCTEHFTLRGSRVLKCSKEKWEVGIEPSCDEYKKVENGKFMWLCERREYEKTSVKIVDPMKFREKARKRKDDFAKRKKLDKYLVMIQLFRCAVASL